MHKPPDSMQNEPVSATDEYVADQIDRYIKEGFYIHTKVALEIASWYTEPNAATLPFIMFVNTGKIDPDFPTSIRTELMRVIDGDRRDALYALYAYVSAAGA